MKDADDAYIREYASPRVDNQSASVVQIESSKLMPLIVLVAILCGASIGLTAFAFSSARNADREARMLQYYLLELDARVIASGIKKPEEAISKKLDEDGR